MVIRSPLKWPLIAAALVLGGIAFAPGHASADFTFQLDTGNPQLSGYSGPYATVTVVDEGNNKAKITFSALSGYGFVAVGSMGLNLASGASWVNGSQGSNGEALNFIGSGNEDGFGNFNTRFKQNDASTPASQEWVEVTYQGSFTLSDILAANSNGAVAAAHIVALNSPNRLTGYAAGSGGGGPPLNDAPAPPTLALALSGLVGAGLAGLRRLRRPRAAAV